MSVSFFFFLFFSFFYSFHSLYMPLCICILRFVETLLLLFLPFRSCFIVLATVSLKKKIVPDETIVWNMTKMNFVYKVVSDPLWASTLPLFDILFII